MKWLWIGPAGAEDPSTCKETDFLTYEKWKKTDADRQLNRARWIPLLKADYVHYRKVKEVSENYDGVILEPLNYPYSFPAHKAREILGKNKIVIAELESLCPYGPQVGRILGDIPSLWKKEAKKRTPLMRHIKEEIKYCDLVHLDCERWMSASFFNKLFKTEKFFFARAPVVNIESLESYWKLREQKERLIFGQQQWWTHKTREIAIEIFKKFRDRGYRWNGIITRTQEPSLPFQNFFWLNWETYKERVSSSFAGIFHATGCTSPGYIAAMLGTPYLGTTLGDGMVDCFPDLAVPFGDVDKSVELLVRLVEDETFYEEVREKARNSAIKYYSWNNARKEFYTKIKKKIGEKI